MPHSGLSVPASLQELLDSLTPAQSAAVRHAHGPAVVFAGAGSGKTRVITTRLLYLCESGVARPQEILAVTFTNRAAREMQERVRRYSWEIAARCQIATFHSTAARWLREFGGELGYKSDFVIFDEQDARTALTEVLNTMGVEKALQPDLARSIARHKGRGETAEDVARLEPTGSLGAVVRQVYGRYQDYLRGCQAMDFGDLLLNLLVLLRRNGAGGNSLRQRIRFVMVDEYQDTNDVQASILDELTGPSHNLLVVGDDDQSIYSWRGAKATNILGFCDRYPLAQQYMLEQNYRCSGNILNAASRLIANNRVRQDKTLWTDNASGDRVQFVMCSTPVDEARAIVDSINLHLSGLPASERDAALGEMAVFYRTNSQSRPIEDAFARLGVPYRVFGGLRFFERAEVRDLIAYMRLLTHPQDDIAFLRVVNTPSRKIGDKTLEPLRQQAADGHTSLMEALRGATLPRTSRLHEFRVLIDELQASAPALLAQWVDRITQAIRYEDYLKKKYPDDCEDRIQNVAELRRALVEAQDDDPRLSLVDWLTRLALAEERAVEDDPKSVVLSTFHMAKGLEFDRVFVVGLVEGLLPFQSQQGATSVEEERRLLYVGMTRARKHLTLLGFMSRMGASGPTPWRISRFVNELDGKSTDFVHSGSWDFMGSPGYDDGGMRTSRIGSEPDSLSYDYDV